MPFFRVIKGLNAADCCKTFSSFVRQASSIDRHGISTSSYVAAVDARFVVRQSNAAAAVRAGSCLPGERAMQQADEDMPPAGMLRPFPFEITGRRQSDGASEASPRIKVKTEDGLLICIRAEDLSNPNALALVSARDQGAAAPSRRPWERGGRWTQAVRSRSFRRDWQAC